MADGLPQAGIPSSMDEEGVPLSFSDARLLLENRFNVARPVQDTDDLNPRISFKSSAACWVRE